MMRDQILTCQGLPAVVLSLFLGALAGGLAAGLGLEARWWPSRTAWPVARKTLFYALLGAFAMVWRIPHRLHPAAGATTAGRDEPLKLDRRAVACALTFGLVTTYMFLPIGFGKIFITDILHGNIIKSGPDVSDVRGMTAMGIPHSAW